MAHTEGSKLAIVSESQKVLSDWSLQLDSMKSESLVIVNQNVTVNTVPGPCTHRPSHHGSVAAKEVGSLTLRGGCSHHFVVHDWGEVVTR